jgi:XisI protein
MDTVNRYRQLLQKILTDYTQVPYAHGDIQFETIFDRESDRYLVVILGRENIRRVHSCLIHADIIDGKVWIQRDGTEEGIASELIKAGIPKEHIVLGFRSPERRKLTELAVA